MKKHIIITLILLALAAYITVTYFRNLNSPAARTANIIRFIPDNTPLIFEFSNDSSFYDIMKGDSLFSAFAGGENISQFDTLRRILLQNHILQKYFGGEHLYISPYITDHKKIDLLVTLSASKNFNPAILGDIGKKTNPGFTVSPFKTTAKYGYVFTIPTLGKSLYVINPFENVLFCSFSEQLVQMAADYKPAKDQASFILLPDKQSSNSLANLYINYRVFDSFFPALFKNQNTDFFKNFRQFAGFGALSLNYQPDALIFNGTTSGNKKANAGYLDAFIGQSPVNNHLKDIFPSTTAYGTSFSVSNQAKFQKQLSKLFVSNGQAADRNNLFRQVKKETGIELPEAFDQLLGNEFALVTTRYFEKLGIVSLTDGSKMNNVLMNLSKITDVNSGQFVYDRLPSFLLGDSFSGFKHPYFTIIDNYLVIANSPGELASYKDTYYNRKFLSKSDQFQLMENLLAGQSNISFFIILKNADPIFKRDMADDFYQALQSARRGWNSFYGVGWQLSAVDSNFYTNFCLKLNSDTLHTKN